MCGIVGFLVPGLSQNQNTLSNLAMKMGDALLHRGPDEGAVWTNAESSVGFGHRRLSIIDLTPTGAQPMTSANGRYTITFNGEIYNYQSIQTELSGKGHRFRGTSDTEVLLAAFVEWGVEATLPKLDGMFAFGLWDRDEKKLFLARDRFGEKPLYYGHNGGHFVFASELKAIKAFGAATLEMDPHAAALFFYHSYIPEPHSIYRGIFKLPPASWLVVDSKGKFSSPRCYWDLREVAREGRANPYRGSFEDALQELDAKLSASVRLRMISDVPLGAFLSGGIDSSLIVEAMTRHSRHPVKTFTIGYNDSHFDESGFAAEVAKRLGTSHTMLPVSDEDCLSTIPLVAAIYDEPFADSSQVPTYLVSRLARRHVTVALTGDGGDELFGGYPRYWRMLSAMKNFERLPGAVRPMAAAAMRAVAATPKPLVAALRVKRVVERLEKLGKNLGGKNPRDLYRAIMCPWGKRPAILNSGMPEPSSPFDRIWEECAGLDLFGAMSLTDQLTFLPGDILAKVDRASMAVSLETRVPLFDPAIAEFVWSMPESYLLEAGGGKRLLKELLYRKVPRSLVDRPKKGFSFPLESWIRGGLRGWAEELLSEKALKEAGVFEVKEVRAQWENFLAGRTQAEMRIWGVLMFQVWHKTHYGAGLAVPTKHWTRVA